METVTETPVQIPTKPAKQSLFTPDNAREMNRRAVEARLRNIQAEKERTKQLEEQIRAVQPLIANAAAQTLEPRDSFVSNRLRIVREQLCKLDEQLSRVEDWKATKAICDSIKALSDVERILDGRALPGSRRPGRESSKDKPQSFEPSE